MENAQKKYLRDLRQLFPLYGRNARKYLKQLEASTRIYCEQHPDASYEDIAQSIGKPLNLIGDYLREEDGPTLIRQVKWRNALQAMLTIVLVGVLSTTALHTYYLYKVYQHEAQTETIYQEERSMPVILPPVTE